MSEEARSQWDVRRFFTTLETYGEVPFLGSFRWLQEWFGQRTAFSGESINGMRKKIQLIGSAPADFVAKLEQAGSVIELSSADAFSSDTASSKIAESTDTTLIWADSTASKKDFSTLVGHLSERLSESSEIVTHSVFDFTQAASNLAAWGVLDDVVMGGVSKGAISISTASDQATAASSSSNHSQWALFAGNISTDNSGGFSSVRTQNFEPPFNFTGWEGLQLRVRGDGQRYKFILRNSEGWDSPAYIYSFDTTKGAWITVQVPFGDMVPTFRAKSVANAAPFSPEKTVSFQLMLSKFEYDRQLNPHFSAGPFELAVEKIETYRARKGVPLVVVGDANESERANQQARLAESGIHYRLVEPNSQNIKAIVEAVLL